MISILSPPLADVSLAFIKLSLIECLPCTIKFLFLAATKQLHEWYFLSVCPSVTPFLLCSHHRIIIKFSGVINKEQGKVHAKGQCQRSKVKVTEATAQLNRFRTVTPVWIHIWWWNDTYSFMLLRRGVILFFKVIRQISRSHGSKIVILTKIGRFRTVTPVWIHWWLWNDAQSLKQHRRGALLFFKVIRQISRSHGSKKHRIWPRLGVSGL